MILCRSAGRSGISTWCRLVSSVVTDILLNYRLRCCFDALHNDRYGGDAGGGRKDDLRARTWNRRNLNTATHSPSYLCGEAESEHATIAIALPHSDHSLRPCTHAQINASRATPEVRSKLAARQCVKPSANCRWKPGLSLRNSDIQCKQIATMSRAREEGTDVSATARPGLAQAYCKRLTRRRGE